MQRTAEAVVGDAPVNSHTPTQKVVVWAANLGDPCAEGEDLESPVSGTLSENYLENVTGQENEGKMGEILSFFLFMWKHGGITARNVQKATFGWSGGQRCVCGRKVGKHGENWGNWGNEWDAWKVCILLH